jgi:MFS family permease
MVAERTLLIEESPPREPTMKRSTLPLLGLLAANALSMTGNVAALVAIPWYVLQTTGSASKTGLSAFFNFLPVALAGFLGGTVVDRFGFKPTSIIADVASSLSIASIPLLQATIGLEYWQLLLFVFLGALLDTPGTTARAALIPEAAELADVSLERATSLADAVNRLSTLVGGPLAGLLIAGFGASNVLWVDAATFALSAALIGAAIPRGLSGGDSAEGQSSYLEDLREGFTYLRRDHLVLSVLLVFTGSNFLDAAFFIFFERVPLEVRGRVLGMGVATVWLAMPLGVICAGFVVELLGVTTTVFVAGGLMLALAFSFLHNGRLRQIA